QRGELGDRRSPRTTEQVVLALNGREVQIRVLDLVTSVVEVLLNPDASVLASRSVDRDRGDRGGTTRGSRSRLNGTVVPDLPHPAGPVGLRDVVLDVLIENDLNGVGPSVGDDPGIAGVLRDEDELPQVVAQLANAGIELARAHRDVLLGPPLKGVHVRRSGLDRLTI